MTSQCLNNKIQQHYPKAITAPDFRQELLKSLQEIGFDDPSRILLAVSLCSDDVNAVHDRDVTWARKHFSNHLLGPFELGGLAGFPFGGLTGISTIAHHVPDDGTALIIFGPHIGVDDEGRLGFLLRPGQHKTSSACGALTLAVNRILDTLPLPQTLDPDDLEQSHLVTQLADHQERIRLAENPLKEATEILYEKIKSSILRYLKEKAEDFKVNEILIAGIILINTGSDHDDYVDVRKLETYRFR